MQKKKKKGESWGKNTKEKEKVKNKRGMHYGLLL